MNFLKVDTCLRQTSRAQRLPFFRWSAVWKGYSLIFSMISVISQNLTTSVNYSVIFHLHLEFLFVFSPINGLFSDHVLNMCLVACSKRSDSGERCEVKKAMKSREGRFYFFALLFTSHRSPLSERLEQAMSLVAGSLRTADAFPVRRERSDNRKCVCCSQARWLNSAPRFSSFLLTPNIEYHFPWFLKVHYSPGSMACGMCMFSQWLFCMHLLLLPQPQVTHF